MALFKSNKNSSDSVVKKDSVNTATIITKGTSIKGNITGNDTIHVDGDIEGSIKVDNIIIVGKSGMVQGDIEANKVISSGHISGDIKCQDLEVMSASTVRGGIHSKKITVKGKIDGEILCDTLVIESEGKVENRVQAKNVTVAGSLNGEVACELLSTKSTGFVKGSMHVNNISNEGGTVEGSIGQYKEIITQDQKVGKKDENQKDKN